MIFNLINLFAGFLASSIIDTSLGEFSEWAVVGASLVVANIEAFNNFYYSLTSKERYATINKSYTVILLDSLNFFKIGLVYGLIVDAFKLGS
jgi:hypothetical protein|tara:strand:+ start:346 stop:621 length:276 start_codon:yes stop_codon:yes gene_type:complete